jgi:hypothetical protein
MTRKIAYAALLGCSALAPLVFACADNLPKATEIVHMRVLGAKLEVVGDEARATPKPGEHVKVSFDTVFPTQKGSNKSSQMMLIRSSCAVPICPPRTSSPAASGCIAWSARPMSPST